MRAILMALSFLAVTLPGNALQAQEQITFRFFHGRGTQSRATVDDTDKRLENQHLKFSRSLLPGSEVCVTVQNAHPVNYKYSLNAIVDSTEPSLPDLSKFTALLLKLPAKVGKTGPEIQLLRNQGDSLSSIPGLLAFRETSSVSAVEDPVTAYYKALRTLSGDIARADSAAIASDTPEPVDGSTPGQAGFGYGQTAIAALSREKYQFNDPKLKDNFAELYKKAKDAATTPNDKILADALGGYADILIAERDKLSASFAPDAKGSPRLCKAVAVGKNSIRLSIAKTVKSGQRDTTGGEGKTPQYFSVEVQSRFQRKIVSIDPLTLGVLTWNVPRFEIDADTLGAPLENPTLARPGIMLSLNPANWGLADDWGLGIGLGLGLGSSDLVTDVLMGLTVSYRSIIRIGVGYGRSRQPDRVRGLKVGQKLPANFGKLEDAVESKQFGKDAIYFLVALPGLSLKSK